MYNFVRDQ